MVYKMSKYYTPTIEEFHIGFEFEHLNYSGKLIRDHPSNTRQWNKEVCDPDWFSILLDDWEHNCEFKDGKCRVRHLDREDIESLGFEYDRASHISYSKGNFKIIRESDKWLYISCFYPEFGMELTLFRGIIKNKSELKKLFKQLGI